MSFVYFAFIDMLVPLSVNFLNRYHRYSMRIIAMIVLIIIVITSLRSLIRMDSCITSVGAEIEPAHRHQSRKINGDVNIRYFERIHGEEYGYIHNPRNICLGEDGKKEPIFLLFLVMSTPREIYLREAIRDSYANDTNWPVLEEGSVRTVFLIGDIDAHDYVTQDVINGEMYYYGDIVQSTEFIDSNSNQTRKIIMGFRWVKDHCRHALYVMKIEERSMVNQRTLIKRLRGNHVLKHFLLGDVVTDVQALRDNMRLNIPPEMIHPNGTLPPFFYGAGYILSFDVVEAIHQVSFSIPFVINTNVYIGLCLQKLGITLIQTPDDVSFSKKIIYNESGRNGVDKFNQCIAIPHLSETEMYILWRFGKI
ncbi:beta-1,3-galactosyltransferase 5-like [Lytechinus pictus]|uniref:beta-1,3-galactosyltransferase 5-like n=1 Tax=Lytechinus pictus TaxID=7653 RepID=UPI0030BA0D82